LNFAPPPGRPLSPGSGTRAWRARRARGSRLVQDRPRHASRKSARAVTDASSPFGPLAALLGIRGVAIERDGCSVALAVRPAHLNPNGVLHGGLPYILVDYPMGAALTTRLEPGERCTTLEIKIQYVAAVRAVHGEAERLVALATGTFFIQTGETGADSSSAGR
jgi:uncharacterized protein (TIGR00369 family)